jgi:hypothetical protein
VLKIAGDKNLNAGGMNYPFLYQTAVLQRIFDSETDFQTVMTHEYGHQLGLGDTYVQTGYQTPEGQPPAVMNNPWEVSDLTGDDMDSVLHAWARVSGRTNAACPNGYVENKPSQNSLWSKFCVKTEATGGAGQIVTFANKCLAIASGAQGAQIVQTDCSNDPNQQFALFRSGGDIYQIKPVATNQCLDIQGASGFDGARLIQWGCHGQRNQQFTLRSLGNNKFTFVNVNSQKCLDIPWSSNRRGIGLIQWSCHGGINQEFTLSGLALPQ